MPRVLARPASDLAPAPDVRIVERSYPVIGRDAPALGLSLARARPRAGGVTCAACTQWTVAWSYRPCAAAGGYLPSEPSVTCAAEIWLPAWCPPPEVAPELVAAWHAALDELRCHELGHVAIGRAAAANVRAAIVATPVAASRAALEDAVTTTVTRVLAAERLRERAYDAASRLGADGSALARFRPPDWQRSWTTASSSWPSGSRTNDA